MHVAHAEASRLLVDLDGRPDVAEGTDPGVPAHGDEVMGPDAQAGEEAGEADGRLERAGPGPLRRQREEVHPHAQELVEEEVAGQVHRPGLEVEEVGLQAEKAGRGGSEPGVVRLQAAEGDDLPRPLLPGVRQQVLELAGLVAAEGWTEQVVTLHKDRPAQLGREALEPLQGRRRLAEDGSREGVQAGEELGGGHASCRASRFARPMIVNTVGRSSASGKTLASHTYRPSASAGRDRPACRGAPCRWDACRAAAS